MSQALPVRADADDAVMVANHHQGVQRLNLATFGHLQQQQQQQHSGQQPGQLHCHSTPTSQHQQHPTGTVGTYTAHV